MTKTECVHHWMLSSGGVEPSIGVCIKCGAQREFDNTEQRSFLPWKRNPKKEREAKDVQ